MKKERPFTKLEASFIPFSMFEKLKKLSYEKRVPISMLIAIAIDNEFDSPNPFNYPVDEPTSEFIPEAFFKEANKIYDFLVEFPQGFDKASLMLLREDIGITGKDEFRFGLRELLLSETLVEFFRPMRLNFPYEFGYQRIRPKQIEAPRRRW
jgi:hypothetical protein